MPIVQAGNHSRVRQVIGWYVAVACALSACALSGCTARSGPRPMIAQAPRSDLSSRSDATQSVVVTETPATTQPQTAPSPDAGITPADVHATTLASTEPTTEAATEPANTSLPGEPLAPSHRAETSNGSDMIRPEGKLIQAEPPPRSSLDFSLNGTYLYGSSRGSTQIPRGGKIGTSNANRPQFHSLGLNTANIADFELAADAHQYGGFFVGAQIIQLNGASYIGNKTLTTDGITYPKDSRISSDIGLNWYRFGYRYVIPIDVAQNGIPDITFTPYAEGIVWDFNYNLTVAKHRSAHRAFAEGGVQVGANFAWRPNGGPLTLEATLGGFPQASHLANVSVESLDLRYHFYEYQRCNFTGLLGVTWEQQDFRDTQRLPNHVSVDFGPMLTAGLQVQF